MLTMDDFTIDDIEPNCVMVTPLLFIGEPRFAHRHYDGRAERAVILMYEGVPVAVHSSAQAREILAALDVPPDEIKRKLAIARYGPADHA